jgi:hypothetical protein
VAITSSPRRDGVNIVEWVFLVLGAILSLIAQALAVRISPRYAKWVAWLRRRWAFRRGRDANPVHHPREADVLPKYFKEAGPRQLDVAVYELSLRPKIPLMDLLYLEYLKQRLENGTVGRVYVVPWSGNQDSDEHRDAETLLRCNLERVFGTSFPKITILFSSDLAPLSNDLLADDFFGQLEALGDSDFLRECSLTMGHRFKSYHDINSGHPEALQARSLVEHSIRGWLIFRYLIGMKLEVAPGSKSPSIGVLMWERELTKLLLLRNLETRLPDARFGLMLGKSVTYRTGMRRVPLPTYQGGETLEIFVDLDELAEKCSTKTVSELAVVTEIVSAILEVNRSPDSPISLMTSGHHTAKSSSGVSLEKHAQTAFQHVCTLRQLYGVVSQ